ncbi:molybdate ABC transporter substrate-binding protein [Paucimonas lemoignei]|nr:molybdate ABC transporter substrate-binding protein [Paucimonas lemoignei]
MLAAGLFLAAASLAHAGEITLSAAASLTNAFREIGAAYEARHPGSKALVNFGASGALLQQMAKGAPVDVFASADQETMNMAISQRLVKSADRRVFARNSLVMVVPRDSRLKIKMLPDLSQPDVHKVAIGNPDSVPVGRYAREALQEARLWPQLQSKTIRTQNVRQSLDYVARGEVDAAFVYATDAALMPDKVRIAMQVPLNEPVLYPIAKTADSENAIEASRFVDFVMSPAGQAILAKYGFLKP